MGSTYFVEHFPFDLDTLDCAIILDLCGHDVSIPGRENALFVLGAEHSPDLLQAVQATQSSAISTYMIRNERIGDMSDHHAFRLRQKPFLFLSCGWWKHYHQPTDMFERLNLTKMAGIADWLVQLVQTLDKLSVRFTPVKDFDRVEVDSLTRLLGDEWPLVLHGGMTEFVRRLIR